jgi:hypothetical protein
MFVVLARFSVVICGLKPFLNPSLNLGWLRQDSSFIVVGKIIVFNKHKFLTTLTGHGLVKRGSECCLEQLSVSESAKVMAPRRLSIARLQVLKEERMTL